MSTLEHMTPVRSIWLRYTDNDGKTHAMEHRVWDKDLFVRTREGDAANEARKKPSGKAKVELISEETYRSER